MNVIIRSIKLPFTASEEEIIEKAKKNCSSVIPRKHIVSAQIHKKSVDARDKGNILFVSSVLFELEDGFIPEESKLEKINGTIILEEDLVFNKGNIKLDSRPIIVGFGPAGMFCALILAEQGYKPIVIERGDSVFNRKTAVDAFFNTGILNVNSNIQFGAGGAGTFSDGKLITRINDSKCKYVLDKFVQMGAPKEILTKARPHIGTDKLLDVVNNIEKQIIELGGEIHYNTTATGFIKNGNRISSVQTTIGDFPCSIIVLATGHSSRDTYSYLLENNYTLNPKPFSVGVRIEHLQEEIDYAMYGKFAGDPRLGHAEYNLSRRTDGRGVYTFCMCPGGEVVAAASEEGRLVTNGMSRFARDGKNANSAIAVDVKPENPMAFQRALEEKAFVLGGKNYNAPIETVGDYLNGTVKNEPSKVSPTYMNGNHFTVADISKIFPKEINDMLSLGLRDFGRKIKGFDCDYAILTGVETRTSAPYRLLRNENKVSVDVDNLYPCGEGAGYAGGITSAAVDGINVATEIIKKYTI